jgi:hypothetical protein
MIRDEIENRFLKKKKIIKRMRIKFDINTK